MKALTIKIIRYEPSEGTIYLLSFSLFKKWCYKLAKHICCLKVEY